MSDMVTRCPACSTSFRITPGQIQKARGAVRCGSCLHIFNAEQYLIAGAKTKPAAKPAPKTPVNPVPTPRQVPLEIDSATDTPKTRPAPPKSAPAASEPKPVVAKTSLREKLAAEKPVVATKAANLKSVNTKPRGLRFDQSQIDRESASDDDDILISDDMDKSKDDDSDDSLLYIDTKPSGRSLFDRDLDADDKPEFTDDSDESWADSLLEEDSPPLQPATKAPPPNPLSIVDTAEVEVSDTAEPHTTSVPEPRFHISGSRDDEEGSYRESIKAFDRERSAMLLNIDPEPVEMTVAEQQQWRRKLLWSGLSVLAVLVLIAQVAWLQFDRLSRVDPYRGYYENLCSVIGCTLPARVDTRQIRSYNLVVRDHPEQSGALLVDAIIINNAGFSQPFPELQLSFSDINNRPVASRAFQPEEYLRGELAGTRTMPTNQPVHLSLEIADPGAHAVNYQLHIH